MRVRGGVDRILGAPTAGALARSGGERRWRPPARPVLIGLLTLEALLGAAFALWPPRGTNRLLDAVLSGLLALAAAGCLLLWRHRGPLALVESCIVFAWGLAIVFIATRDLEASQLLWAVILVLIAVAAGFYLPSRPAAYQVASMVVLYLLAALAFPPPTRALFAGGVAVCIVVCSFAVILMRQDRDRVLLAAELLATTDPLTGLLNRRGLQAEAEVVHANASRAGLPTVVVVVDVDGLKAVNDEQGHDVGDALLASVAHHWDTHLRKGDLVGRIGGDEFVMVLPQTDPGTAAELIARLRSGAPAPWSRGWTVWDAYEALDTALERADTLMYADKAERRAADPPRAT